MPSVLCSYAQSLALNGVSGLLDEICDCLDALGIPVEQFHAESGPGQFEIPLAPTYGDPSLLPPNNALSDPVSVVAWTTSCCNVTD